MKKFISLKISAFETSWGWMASAISDSGLAALTLPQPTRFRAEESLADQVGSINLAKGRNNAVEKQLNGYFKGQRKSFDIPLDLSLGTPFQSAVWGAAANVPFGEQRSYSWVGRKISAPLAMRAVGSALGSNPIAIVVPCHRIIRSDGGLGRYGGGIPMKRKLLQLESHDLKSTRSLLLAD